MMAMRWYTKFTLTAFRKSFAMMPVDKIAWGTNREILHVIREHQGTLGNIREHMACHIAKNNNK
jgi:hypothetical protein